MKLHPVRVVLLVVVAINALSVSPFRTEHVVVDDAFVVVLQTTLINGQFFVSDIRRGNEPVADIRVYGIGRDVDIEGLETLPVTVSPRKLPL
jgi:hypothetical protein